MLDKDGNDVNLQDATLEWNLNTRTGEEILNLDSTNNSSNFVTLNTNGEESATGSVVRVILSDSDNATLVPGLRRHQLTVTKSGIKMSLGTQAIEVRDGITS